MQTMRFVAWLTSTSYAVKDVVMVNVMANCMSVCGGICISICSVKMLLECI